MDTPSFHLQSRLFSLLFVYIAFIGHRLQTYLDKAPFTMLLLRLQGGRDIKNSGLKELKWSTKHLYLLNNNQFSFPFTIYTTYNTIQGDTTQCKKLKL